MAGKHLRNRADMFVVIGSKAVIPALPRKLSNDTDLVCSFDDAMRYSRQITEKLAAYPSSNGKKFIIKENAENIHELEIAWDNTSSKMLMDIVLNDKDTEYFGNMAYPHLDILYTLKMSHRYLKNSPHFLKTMNDILMMRNRGAKIRPEHKEFYKLRQKETYSYEHPKLNVDKKDFFSNDGITYIYDHDSIHLAMKHLEYPAYHYFQPENSEILCSREMFEAAPEQTKLFSVLEETYVLALERSQIPHGDTISPRKSFEIALKKVCTSITSGFWREYAWENYYTVSEMYDEKYVSKFFEAVEKGIVIKN